MSEKIYISIDLKSFYASVECLERGLNPLTNNLVVADGSKTEKTICLAVSPSLKKYGISGRARLFEVVQKVNEVNFKRKYKAPNRTFKNKTHDDLILQKDNSFAVDYIVAPPRMQHYIDYSTRIYEVYLKYVAHEDIHVYSIDEVFIDITNYLKTYKKTPHELAKDMIQDVLKTTGITATAGIGTNMYLAKIAMDIMAKKIPADKDGVRISELNEYSYREHLWTHRPLTDFWRVGKGYSKKLEASGLYTMGDIARCSLGKPNEYFNENLLYKMFGINAELLIDHAWGYEPCTISDVKMYKPANKSVGTGQVLLSPYICEDAKLVVREMTDLLVLDLVDKKLVTDQIVLTVGYDIENLTRENIDYHGEITTDMYGRKTPKHAHGTANLDKPCSSTKLITNAVMELFDRIIDEKLLVRRINISANRVISEDNISDANNTEQLNLYTNYAELDKKRERENIELEREKKAQHALIDIKKKYGKNAIFKGMNLKENATARNRNRQIGGHKA